MKYLSYDYNDPFDHKWESIKSTESSSISSSNTEIRLNFLIKTHDSSILKASDPLAIPPQPKAKRIDINNVVTNEGDLLDMNNAVRTI